MITFEEVFSWLNEFGSSHLRPSSISLITHMNTALEAGQSVEAAGLLQQLKDHAYKLKDDPEVTEILLECAKTTYRLGALDQAVGIFEECVSRSLPDLHRRAVVQWLLGAIQWRTMPRRDQAVVSWRNSISDFGRLAKQPSLPRQQRTWYKETCQRLEQSLVEALEDFGRYMDLLQAPDTSEVDQTLRPEQFSASFLPSGSSVTLTSEPHLQPEPGVTQTSDFLELFAISEEIPAGGFGPSGVDPFPVGNLEVNQVLIDGHPHRIVNLRDGRSISMDLLSGQRYTVLRVVGDSMNEEGILEGDYVLLRQSDTPKSGDIVAAEIVEASSTTATLKKYLVNKLDENGNRLEITLQPHSSNPNHVARTFTGNNGFFIRGIALAVFKQI